MDDRKEQDGPTELPTFPRRALAGFRRNIGRIVAATILAIIAGLGIFVTGYAVGSNSSDSKTSETTLPPIHDSDTMPHVAPPRVCGAPSPLNPGTDIHEPTETDPQPPTETCVPPSPDIIVLLSPTKAKALPANTGACATANGYGTLYTCGPRSYKDVETFATKVLTPEQLAFVNDHMLATPDALWAFDVRDTAVLKGQSTSPGATYDEASETITVYVW